VKSTLTTSNPYCSMIEFGSVHGSQGAIGQDKG
jgi:hypothetical protein